MITGPLTKKDDFMLSLIFTYAHRVGLWCVVTIGCLGLLTNAQAQTNIAPKAPVVASYDIKVKLLPKEKMLDANMTMTWRNTAQTPVTDMWFHLYINAFKNEKSTFFQDLRRMGRFGSFGKGLKKGRWGWTKIDKILTTDNTNLAPKIEYKSPDDGNKDDRTVFRIVLPQPIAPGASIKLQFKFKTKLPWAIARTGYRKNYFFAGQWYPKVGVLETKGTRGAKQARWNCHQFHATSEFYADWGTYNVTVDVPSEYVVGATGKQVAKAQKGKRTIYTFHQKHVHDFAWTASPTYFKVTRTFSNTKDVSTKQRQKWAKRLGLKTSDLQLKDVQMIFLLQKEHKHLTERHVKALKDAIRAYGLWLGPYPYDTITLVDPAYEGKTRGFSGMEYQTLFTAGTRWWPSSQSKGLEFLVLHEYGHQYFQGMLASNEFEEPWLDEGINTYTNGVIMDDLHPKNYRVLSFLHVPMWLLGFELGGKALNRIGFLSITPKVDPLNTPAWKFQSTASYGANSYSRTGVTFDMLERMVGTNKMHKALRDYYQRWRFKHPNGNDFQASLEKSTGRSLDGFFKQYVRGTKELDYAVASISSRKIKAPKGAFDDNKVNKGKQKASKKPLPKVPALLGKKPKDRQPKAGAADAGPTGTKTNDDLDDDPNKSAADAGSPTKKRNKPKPPADDNDTDNTDGLDDQDDTQDAGNKPKKKARKPKTKRGGNLLDDDSNDSTDSNDSDGTNDQDGSNGSKEAGGAGGVDDTGDADVSGRTKKAKVPSKANTGQDPVKPVPAGLTGKAKKAQGTNAKDKAPKGTKGKQADQKDSTKGTKGIKGTKAKDKKASRYLSKVLITRRGDAIMPVEIKVVFEDGKVINETWDGKGRWVRFMYKRKSKLKSVEVDPKAKYALDVNIANNSRTRKPKAKVTFHWFVTLMSWLQHLMLALINLL